MHAGLNRQADDWMAGRESGPRYRCMRSRSIRRLSRWSCVWPVIARCYFFFCSCQEKLPEKALVSSSCPGLCRTERWDQTAEKMRARYKLEKGVLPLSHFFYFKGRGITLKSRHSCFFLPCVEALHVDQRQVSTEQPWNAFILHFTIRVFQVNCASKELEQCCSLYSLYSQVCECCFSFLFFVFF